MFPHLVATFMVACVLVTFSFAMFATPDLDSVLLRICSVDLEDCFWSQVWALSLGALVLSIQSFVVLHLHRRLVCACLVCEVFITWFLSSTHLKVDLSILDMYFCVFYKGFSDLEDFWDDLPVSRLKYNALDDFQEVFQATSRKSSRRLPGSLPGDFQEVFQANSRKSSRRLPGSRLDLLEVF
ncbi:hypothetical protein DY000_02028694 [Brassica cretica]|uniref:Uncharacterized protein n=1 Tax=Brassica cretica TaxID=69181 RepID=A0ABQ7DNY3_BRACR|nr:hypothetical protein DY000_02028694 [Brassica cretica]